MVTALNVVTPCFPLPLNSAPIPNAEVSTARITAGVAPTIATTMVRTAAIPNRRKRVRPRRTRAATPMMIAKCEPETAVKCDSEVRRKASFSSFVIAESLPIAIPGTKACA
ncbi:Uncharacterised protein [Chlamydia trachomatis]|nr:Uncharacterised protein [Chlamydia trachomatis]